MIPFAVIGLGVVVVVVMAIVEAFVVTIWGEAVLVGFWRSVAAAMATAITAVWLVRRWEGER